MCSVVLKKYILEINKGNEFSIFENKIYMYNASICDPGCDQIVAYTGWFQKGWRFWTLFFFKFLNSSVFHENGIENDSIVLKLQLFFKKVNVFYLTFLDRYNPVYCKDRFTKKTVVERAKFVVFLGTTTGSNISCVCLLLFLVFLVLGWLFMI